MTKKIKHKDSKNKPHYFIIQTAVISLSALLGTWMLIAYYFRIISPVTILANVIIVPYVTLVSAIGVSFIVLGPISPIFAKAFSASTELAVSLLIKTTTFLSRLPYAYFEIKSINFYFVIAYYVIILAIFSLIRIKSTAVDESDE